MVSYRLLSKGSINCDLKDPSIDSIDASNCSAVSAIMITRGDKKKIYNSLLMFEHQKWSNKEIVVVCDCNEKLISDMLETFSFRSTLVPVNDSKLVLGDLRNIGIAASSGEYICQWDDDDLYHPMRISIMMAALSRSNADAAFLDQWFIFHYGKKQLALSHIRVWEGSIVMKRSSAIIYPSRSKSEDTEMVNQLLNSRLVALVRAPGLYTYCITGDNTWGEEHMNQILNNAVRHFGKEEAAKIMQENPAFETVLKL